MRWVGSIQCTWSGWRRWTSAALRKCWQERLMLKISLWDTSQRMWAFNLILLINIRFFFQSVVDCVPFLFSHVLESEMTRFTPLYLFTPFQTLSARHLQPFRTTRQSISCSSISSAARWSRPSMRCKTRLRIQTRRWRRTVRFMRMTCWEFTHRPSGTEDVVGCCWGWWGGRGGKLSKQRDLRYKKTLFLVNQKSF